MTVPTAPADRLRKAPRQITIGIYLVEAAADALDHAVAQLAAAGQAQTSSRVRRITERRAAGLAPARTLAAIDAEDEAVIAPLREKAEQARAALDAATLWLTFRSMPRTKFLALVDAHPARPGDPQGAQFHAGTLVPVLLQACCVQPVLDDEDIREMFDGEAWSDAELGALTAAALAVNTATRLVPQAAR